MKKIFTIAAAILASVSLMAVEPTLETSLWGADDFETVIADHDGIVLSTSLTQWGGNFANSEVRYLNMGGGTDLSAAAPAPYFAISSATIIDSVEIYWAPNNTDASNLAWAAWKDNANLLNQDVDYLDQTAEFTGSKSVEGATWQKIDLEDKEVKAIMIGRQIKKAKLNGTEQSNIGKNKTVNIIGVRVWLNNGVPAPTYTVTYKANNGSEVEDVVVEGAKKIAENTFAAQEGFKFVGWNTAADGSGDDYEVGAKVESDLTLYAQWEKVCHKVIYDLVEGIGSAEVTAADATITEDPLSLKISNSAGRITLTPLAGYTFKKGDIIEFSGTVGNSGKPFGIKVGSDVYEAAEVIPNNPEVPTEGGTASFAGVLKSDAETLVIGRDGGTTTTLLTLVIKQEVSCDDTTTAIDNANAEVKAVKHIVNGQLVIEKNGVLYNAQGAVVR